MTTVTAPESWYQTNYTFYPHSSGIPFLDRHFPGEWIIGPGLSRMVKYFHNPAIMLNIVVRSVALGNCRGWSDFGASLALQLTFRWLIRSASRRSCLRTSCMGIPVMSPWPLHRVFGIGRAIGLANGVLVTKLKVNPFIATLGTSLIIKGIINATFSNYTGSVPESFQYLRLRND